MPGNFGQALYRCFRIVMVAAVERQFAGNMCLRQRNDAFAPRTDDAVLSEIVHAGLRDFRRRRRQIVQFREWRHDRFAKCLHESTGNRRRGFHGYLLPKYCPQAHLKTVERARHSRARIRCNQRT